MAPPLTGLIARFKSDTGVTDAGGGRVSAWADQSGNGFDIAQGTAGKRPLLVNNEFNGKPVIRFDRSRVDTLSRATTPNVGGGFMPYSYVAIVKRSNSGILMWLWGAHNSFRCLGFDSSNRPCLFGGSSVAHNGVADDGDFHVFIGNFDAASSEIFIDGVGSGAINPGSSGANVGLVLGSGDSSNSDPFSGDFLEVFFYDHVLDATEVSAMQDYYEAEYLNTGSAFASDGLGEFVAVGAPIASGVASLAGTGTAAFVGSGIATGAFSISAAGAAAFNSANFLDMVLSSAGIGAAAFVGFDDTGGVLAAAGSGQAAWTGRTVKDIVLGASGTSVCGWSSEATEIEFFMEGFSNCQWVGSPLGGRNWIPDAPAPDGWVAQEPVA